MENFEKPGVFYLGKEYGIEQGRLEAEPLLFDSGDLRTHAVRVGLTGSGNTGLCVFLLEVALIDGIPAIVIDPRAILATSR